MSCRLLINSNIFDLVKHFVNPLLGVVGVLPGSTVIIRSICVERKQPWLCTFGTRVSKVNSHGCSRLRQILLASYIGKHPEQGQRLVEMKLNSSIGPADAIGLSGLRFEKHFATSPHQRFKIKLGTQHETTFSASHFGSYLSSSWSSGSST